MWSHTDRSHRLRISQLARFSASILSIFILASNLMVSGLPAFTIDAKESKKLSRQFLKEHHTVLYERLAADEPKVTFYCSAGKVWRVQYMLTPRAKGNWVYVDIDAVSGKAHLLQGK